MAKILNVFMTVSGKMNQLCVYNLYISNDLLIQTQCEGFAVTINR